MTPRIRKVAVLCWAPSQPAYAAPVASTHMVRPFLRAQTPPQSPALPEESLWVPWEPIQSCEVPRAPDHSSNFPENTARPLQGYRATHSS